MKKILNIVEIVLLAIGVLSVVLWIVGVTDVDLMLYVAYAYLGIATVVAVVMTAMNMGKGKSNSKAGLFVFGTCAILAVVFYFVLASGTPVTDAGGVVYDNAFTLKITDTMLYMAYTTLGGALLFMLGGEIWKALK